MRHSQVHLHGLGARRAAAAAVHDQRAVHGVTLCRVVSESGTRVRAWRGGQVRPHRSGPAALSCPSLPPRAPALAPSRPAATAAPLRPDNATSWGSPAKFTKKYEKKIKIQLQVLEIPGGRSYGGRNDFRLYIPKGKSIIGRIRFESLVGLEDSGVHSRPVASRRNRGPVVA